MFTVCFITLLLTIISSEVNKQRDAQLFFMYVYFYSLHVSGSHVPIIRRINLYQYDIWYMSLCIDNRRYVTLYR